MHNSKSKYLGYITRNRNFQSSSPFERSASFYVTISGHFERYQYFNFETNFLENGNLFQKIGVPFFR